MKEAQRLIEKGVGAVTILRILATLMPSALGVTIPVALLVGLLIGLGRLSADREAVALQACGVSLTRLLRPVAACAAGGLPGDRLRDDLGDAGRQQALPGAAGRSRRRPHRHRDQAAGLLRGLPEPDVLFARTSPATAPAGATSSWPTGATPTGRSSWSPHAAGWSSTRRPGRSTSTLWDGSSASGRPEGPGHVRGPAVHDPDGQARRQRRLPEDRRSSTARRR